MRAVLRRRRSQARQPSSRSQKESYTKRKRSDAKAPGGEDGKPLFLIMAQRWSQCCGSLPGACVPVNEDDMFEGDDDDVEPAGHGMPIVDCSHLPSILGPADLV